MKCKLPPDKRLDWRDQNMPVLRMAKAKLPDGRYEEYYSMQEVAPHHVQEYHAWNMNMDDGSQHFSCDPSYWWGKR